MPFEKGVSGNPETQFKSLARKRGRPPRRRWRTYIQDLFERAETEEGFCPFTELKKIAQNYNETTSDRIKALIEICNYLAPKVRAVDGADTDKRALNLNISLNGQPISADVSETNGVSDEAESSLVHEED